MLRTSSDAWPSGCACECACMCVCLCVCARAFTDTPCPHSLHDVFDGTLTLAVLLSTPRPARPLFFCPHLLQREQHLTLARDHASSSLDHMRSAFDSERAGIECLEHGVANIEFSLHALREKGDKGRLVAVEKELRRALRVKDEEMQLLQRQMSHALVWASQ